MLKTLGRAKTTAAVIARKLKRSVQIRKELHSAWWAFLGRANGRDNLAVRRSPREGARAVGLLPAVAATCDLCDVPVSWSVFLLAVERVGGTDN
jgi:hypothetical protein